MFWIKIRGSLFLLIHFIYFFPPQKSGAGFDEKSNKKIHTVEKKLRNWNGSLK